MLYRCQAQSENGVITASHLHGPSWRLAVATFTAGQFHNLTRLALACIASIWLASLLLAQSQSSGESFARIMFHPLAYEGLQQQSQTLIDRQHNLISHRDAAMQRLRHSENKGRFRSGRFSG